MTELTEIQRIEQLEKDLVTFVGTLKQIKKDMLAYFAIPVEDTIEFEGKQYRKVDRLAQVGDVVFFRSDFIPEGCLLVKNKPYSVMDFMGKVCVEHDKWNHYEVYTKAGFRTPKDIDVYELIKQDVQRQIVPCAAAKTANELRAEIIEKAKMFVDESSDDDFHFEIYEEKRTVLCWKLVSNGAGYNTVHGLSTCHINDVYNEHIEKAIALGRALNLDVSEFEQAVQPTKVVVGQEVISFKDNDGITHVQGEIVGLVHQGFKFREEDYRKWIGCNADWTSEMYGYKIINDTNAVYNKEVTE